MRCMLLEKSGAPLREAERPLPEPGPGAIRIRVLACGVCRTDLHLLDGELPHPRLPVVPGHEVVGEVEALGPGVVGLTLGQRVGVPWLGRVCGHCSACRRGEENLCAEAAFHGYTLDGGYAEALLADAAFVFPLPAEGDPAEQAPLLCAGLIGFRSWRMAGAAERLGLYGFGAAAHILVQLAVPSGQRVFAFTRPGDRSGQEFARRLGAAWAGSSEELPPESLDAAILFAPVGALVPAALRAVRPGGRVVCAGIHMSDIPSFPYSLLWGERRLLSVANLTRRDGKDFFELVARHAPRAVVHRYPLGEASRALADLRGGAVEGAAVLIP